MYKMLILLFLLGGHSSARADLPTEDCTILDRPQARLTPEMNSGLSLGKYSVEECVDKLSKRARYFVLSRPKLGGNGICRYSRSDTAVATSIDAGRLNVKSVEVGDDNVQFAAVAVEGGCPPPSAGSYFYASNVPDQIISRLSNHWKAIRSSDVDFKPVLEAYDVDGMSDTEMREERALLNKVRHKLSIRAISVMKADTSWWRRMFTSDQMIYAIVLKGPTGLVYTLQFAVSSRKIMIVDVSRSLA